MADIFVILTIVSIIIWMISYGFKQYTRKIIHNNKYLVELCTPYDQHPIEIQFTSIPIAYNDVVSSIETVPLIDQRQLIYYIDGSYSHRMQIGHSGFRASNGSSIVQYYSPQCSRRGSTESEVFAACLAIEHAMKNCHNKLIIRTDNSKVEQLLSRPKAKDTCEYPSFCHILNAYRQENEKNIIQVEHVRGHTTRYEQNQCEIKRQFARIDRLVRMKNRRYIRRQRMKSERYCLYWYS